MGYFMFDKRRFAGDGVSSVTEMSLRKTHRRQAASHSSPWLQQDLGMTLSTGGSMIGVLEITLIVPTLWWECLSGRSASALECGADVCHIRERYPRHALG